MCVFVYGNSCGLTPPLLVGARYTRSVCMYAYMHVHIHTSFVVATGPRFGLSHGKSHLCIHTHTYKCIHKYIHAPRRPASARAADPYLPNQPHTHTFIHEYSFGISHGKSHLCIHTQYKCIHEYIHAPRRPGFARAADPYLLNQPRL